MKLWPIKPILEVATIVSSRVQPFKGRRKYIATGGLDGRTVVSWEDVDFSSKPSRADLVAEKGDVLFARMQATNKVTLVTGDVDNYIWSTGFAVLRPKAHLRSRFLMHYLASPTFQAAKDTQCTGATQKALPNDGLRKLALPVPPLLEQDKILKLLDEADELRRLRAQADTDTASLVPALFHRMFGDPITNTKGFPIATLGEFASVQRGKFTPRPRNDPSYFGGSHPFIQTGDIANSNGLVTTYTQTLNEKGKKVSKEFPAGSLVIAIVGATIGQTAILGIPVFATDSVIAIQPDRERALTEYLHNVLKFWRPVFLAQAPETARANLNAATLKAVKIPIPPIALQKVFADRVNEIRGIEAAQALSRTSLDSLFQSMLHNAFNGC
jgi:restriction endonuclease S subunit